MKTLGALAAGLMAAACLPASGQTLAFDLTGSGGTGSTGNTLVFTQSGLTVKASAWGYTYGPSDNALEKAKLGQWDTGLGVTNASEDGSSPGHQVDNAGPDDWVLFVFSKPVDIASITIDPYGSYDRDVTYWVGNIDPGLNLTNKTYANLASLGFFTETSNDGTKSDSPRTVPITGDSGGVNAILFGAKKGEFSSSDQDYFKISSLCVTVVPEPSSMALAALGALGFAARRRRSA